MAGNSKTTEKVEVKKPFIKNNTLMAIIIAIGVIGAIAVFAMNFLNSREKKSSSNVAEIEWQKIADYVTDMVANGDLNISYVDTAQRKKLIIAGSNEYYSVQHNGNNLYFWQGNYTQAATTDDLKVTEAKADSNTKMFSDCVLDFAVENYNSGNNTFSDQTVKIRLRVEKDGKIKQESFVASMPVKE